MDDKFLKLIRTRYDEGNPPQWDNGLLRKNGSGHTVEVANHPSVHPGRDSAAAYVLGKLLGKIDAESGKSTLEAIEELQVRDENNPRYGAFRWYREESKPNDTNAAFFTLLPLVAAVMFEPDLLSSNEMQILKRMLFKARKWFVHECENPILFYTNKIISDGAMLTAIGKLTEDDEAIGMSREFLNKWLDYTEKRGFGWGENYSPGYNGVTVQALTVIRKALEENDKDILIAERINNIEKDILETFRFNNGYEFVPAIRSYNVNGELKPPYILNNLAQVSGFGVAGDMFKASPEKPDALSNLAIAILIYGDRLYVDEEDYVDKGYMNSMQYPALKKTHIMDDVKASTWIGKNGGLGSLSRFPVIDGSYQHKGWGLGWQCFPVSSIIYGGQVSFLRFNVNDGEKMRHHPHKDKHTAYLDPSLFSESFYPDVKTACAQNDNTVIAFRSIEKLRNRAKLITDSFDVRRFNGKFYEINSNGYEWFVLSYKNAVLCLGPLMGIKEGSGDYSRGSIEVDKNDNGIRLVQTLYNGELKSLFDDRICAGWIIHLIDRGMEFSDIGKYLKTISINETVQPDGYAPRTPQWYIHNVEIYKENELLVSFAHDPY